MFQRIFGRAEAKSRGATPPQGHCFARFSDLTGALSRPKGADPLAPREDGSWLRNELDDWQRAIQRIGPH